MKANFVIHDHPDMPGGFLRLGLFRLVLICLRFPFVVFPPVLPSSETTCGVGLAMNRVLKHLKETGALSSHLPTKWRDIKESRGKLRDFYSDVSTFFENGAPLFISSSSMTSFSTARQKSPGWEDLLQRQRNSIMENTSWMSSGE